MRSVFKGLLFGLPLSMAMWSLLAFGAYELAYRHPHALTHIEDDVELAVGEVPASG